MTSCVVCYATPEDIDPLYKHSFINLPCKGTEHTDIKHVLCFTCFMLNESTKCPVCRFNYKTMTPNEERIHEDEDEEPEDINVNELDIMWRQYRHIIPFMINFMNEHKLIDNNSLVIADLVKKEYIISTINDTALLPEHFNDIVDIYCARRRIYLTGMLISYTECIEDPFEEDFINFKESLQDYITNEVY